jgi:hypothetical protein
MIYSKGDTLIHRKTGRRFIVEGQQANGLVTLQEDGKAHPSEWPNYEVDSDFLFPPDLIALLEIPYSPASTLKKSPVECHRIMNNQRRALLMAVQELSSEQRTRDSILHLILKELTAA